MRFFISNRDYGRIMFHGMLRFSIYKLHDFFILTLLCRPRKVTFLCEQQFLFAWKKNLLFLPFLFEKFDVTLIPMKPVDQSHIRAALLVTEQDCICPNWSRLWTLFPVRPLSRLTSEIVSCNTTRTRRAAETLRNRFNLPVGRARPPSKKRHFARCHVARWLR